ncbi:MAG: sugar transferase [Calditrichaeota bacterium]|nr:sugar transferase [Calditrichota bacterium]
MISYRRHRFVASYQVFDAVVILSASVLASVAASMLGIAAPLSWPPSAKGLTFLFGTLAGFLVVFGSTGLYLSRRLEQDHGEARQLLKATGLGLIWTAALATFLGLSTVGWAYLLCFGGLAFVGTVLARKLARRVLQRVRLRGRNLRHVVIVGSGRRAERLLEKLRSRPELGYHIKGYVDNRVGSGLDGLPYLCTTSDFGRYLVDNVVDEVFITLPIKSHYEEIRQILSVCEEQGVLVRIPSDLFDLNLAKTTSADLDGTLILTLYTGSDQHLYHMWAKRTMDVVVSAFLLVLLSPVFLLAALLIKLTSPGPVFFKQKRMGYNKRIFEIYKFRTMVVDAEKRQAELEDKNEVPGPVFKMHRDPRVTPVGRWLRRLSIDELPQLINVLKGDMSLVGPRPLPLRDVSRFDQDWVRRRFSVRPGITCSWQISGRSEIPFDQWMRLDLEYIDNWSLGLDLQILLKTVPAVLRGTGAM